MRTVLDVGLSENDRVDSPRSRCSGLKLRCRMHALRRAMFFPFPFEVVNILHSSEILFIIESVSMLTSRFSVENSECLKS
jgi:hypothetical protein